MPALDGGHEYIPIIIELNSFTTLIAAIWRMYVQYLIGLRCFIDFWKLALGKIVSSFVICQAQFAKHPSA